MNAHSSEHPIAPPGHSAARIAGAVGRALPGRADMKAAVAVVLRERRRGAGGRREASNGSEAIEAEVMALLYGDASARRRAFDTQPSHLPRVDEAPTGERRRRAGAS